MEGISSAFQWCQDFKGTGRARRRKNGLSTFNLLLLLTSATLEQESSQVPYQLIKDTL